MVSVRAKTMGSETDAKIPVKVVCEIIKFFRLSLESIAATCSALFDLILLFGLTENNVRCVNIKDEFNFHRFSERRICMFSRLVIALGMSALLAVGLNNLDMAKLKTAAQDKFDRVELSVLDITIA